MTAQGWPIEIVARRAVAARNQLKAEFREGMPPEMVDYVETRNRDRYGDPLGPTPEVQLARYGSWQAVMEAACRPSSLA